MTLLQFLENAPWKRASNIPVQSIVSTIGHWATKGPSQGKRGLGWVEAGEGEGGMVMVLQVLEWLCAWLFVQRKRFLLMNFPTEFPMFSR